ncbi:hypothetical protein [Larkinella punicea]|uniref:Uncharacterized protein n=1 Tax=Larkinella punicea TaxID=2315727 RepID=A0A368JLN1_9BACT|nr:hypothetical protein [Larkinella punicea]RCR67463.1 hypothetical protein DUE52_21925 [Larkinella punicea]
MKNILFALAVVSILFTGCSGNNSEEHTHDGKAHDHEAGTHKHEDGTEHADHAKSDSTQHQEEFTVGSDSTSKAEKPHAHPHKH